jgi:hypothetical protein
VQETVKRILVAGIAFGVLLSVLFFVPEAFGWRTANVNSYNAGTFYPQTVTASTSSPAPLISCEQTSAMNKQATLNLTKNKSPYGSGVSFYSCTNNWGSDVTFNITVSNGGLTGLSLSGATLTIQPGQTKCISATVSTGNKAGDVLYSVSATATDLSATIQFAGHIAYPGTDSAECSFP